MFSHYVSKPQSGATIEYTDFAVKITAEPYTFTSVSIGDADADRIVALVATGTSGNPFATLNVNAPKINGSGGTSMTQVVRERYNTVDGTSICGIWAYAWPTGTTTSFYVDFTGDACKSCSITVYSIIGIGSTTPYATATNRLAKGVNGSVSVDVNCEAGGVAIGAAHAHCLSNGTMTLTGDLTEDVNDLTLDATYYHRTTVGSWASLAAETPVDIDFAYDKGSGSNRPSSYCAASWSKA